MGDGKMAMIVPKDVRMEIEELLQDRFDMPEDFVPGGEYDNFLGLRGLLAPRGLTYLAYILEQRYDIQFGMEEYNDPRFYSLSGLSEMIANKVNKQPKKEVNP